VDDHVEEKVIMNIRISLLVIGALMAGGSSAAQAGCCSREARLGWLSPWNAAMWHWNANGAHE